MKKYEIISKSLGMTVEEYIRYLNCRIDSLTKELDKSRTDFLGIAQSCSDRALQLKVTLSNPDFDQPIANLKKTY